MFRLSRNLVVKYLALFLIGAYVLSGLIPGTVQNRLNSTLVELRKPALNSSDVIDAVVTIRVYQSVPYYGSQPFALSFPSWTNGYDVVNVGSGSGFFFTTDGYLLTNKHVVSDSSAVYTVDISENKEIPAIVIYRDPIQDLAIMKVEGKNFPTIQLGDSSQLRIGQKITGIGNAYGEVPDSKSEGTISAMNRNVYVSDSDGVTERLRGLIQISAPLYPGDSGGPLLNSQNEAVGVNVASAIGENIGFSIPINIAKETITKAGLRI